MVRLCSYGYLQQHCVMKVLFPVMSYEIPRPQALDTLVIHEFPESFRDLAKSLETHS